MIKVPDVSQTILDYLGEPNLIIWTLIPRELNPSQSKSCEEGRGRRNLKCVCGGGGTLPIVFDFGDEGRG